ncbi:DUF1488 domain-containing protein [Psychromonas aquimarina]|uniref:DUF1488 domain-containing protein n=1 Tax=Psychromonas aquimarina TaxID=444919 RepID=UPI00041F01C8|nr:DUF1488 domain-containing protein [Psychromonas aquimarina]
MNQSILFPELQSYCELTEHIEFPAQTNGQLIYCVLGRDKLHQISQEQSENEAQLLALFEQYRFDIEELAEQLIENEQFAEDGKIYI